jgi:hypothetical protein
MSSNGGRRQAPLTAAPASMNYVLQRQVFSFVWAARQVTLSEVKF